MKATALLTALLSILLAGCSLGAKPANAVVPPAAPKAVVKPAPTPPPRELSIPQTHVELPEPQPVDPEAFSSDTTPPEPVPAATPPPRPRRPGPVTSQPASPPVAAAPAEPRESVQEIVAPVESKRLQERAFANRKEATQILDQLSRRPLTATQHNVATTIKNFVALSEEAEKHNDVRQADAFAERAQILAKELQSGK